MLKCVVQNCEDTCFRQCYKRISPQRAEAIKNLNISHTEKSNVCAVCKREFIKAKRNNKELLICACRVE